MPQSVNSGGSAVFTAVPLVGFVVDEWRVNSVAVQSGRTNYILEDVTGDSTVQVTFKLADSDGDGIEDSWEMQHFGDIAAQDATGDPDGDGIVNGEEANREFNPTVFDSPARKPDALIGVSPRELIGGGRFDWYASGQAITTTAGPLRSRIAYVQIRNAGRVSDTLRLRGDGADAGFRVRYFLVSGANVVNVTNPMTSGSLLLRNVQPGARRVLKVVVVPLAGTAAGASQGLYVDVWSDVEKKARDSVFLKVDVQ